MSSWVESRPSPPADTGLPGDDVHSQRELCWFVSLAGDCTARVASVTPQNDKPPTLTRYEWAVGITCCREEEKWWHWQAALRSEDALKVQLLIKPPPSGGWSEHDAQLLALRPSRDTRTWLEENSSEALKTLVQFADLAGKAPATPAQWKGGLGLLNAIPSEASKLLIARRKNWFLYRFFDARTGRAALEWTISKAVIREYGPLLRGTVDVAFYGEPGPAKIGLRVGLGFKGMGDLHYSHPHSIDDTDRLLHAERTVAVEP